MFRASSRPLSGATTTAVAASGLPSERGGSSAVGRGRAGQILMQQKRKKILINICKEVTRKCDNSENLMLMRGLAQLAFLIR